MKRISVLLAVVVTAVAASACCILPLLLGAASAGTVGLGAAATPYRPYFIALTVLLLGAAFYFTYRPEKAGSGPDCCDAAKTARTRRISRALLWVVTIFTVGAVAYPNIVAYRARVSASSAPRPAAPAQAQTVQFHIPSMDCAACAVDISDKLRRTPGVYDAKVEFDTKKATVQYDARRVGVAQLRDAIDRTGYPAAEVDTREPGRP